MWPKSQEAVSPWAVALTEGKNNGFCKMSLSWGPDSEWGCFLCGWVTVYSREGPHGERIKWLWAGVGAQNALSGPHHQQCHTRSAEGPSQKVASPS